MIRNNESARDAALRIVTEQPDDSSIEEIIRELMMHRMIERGIADAEAGRTVSHEEMKARVESWLK